MLRHEPGVLTADTLADLLSRRPLASSAAARANNLGGRSFVLTAGST